MCNHPLLVLPKDHELQSKLTSTESVSYSGKLLALQQLLQDCGIGELSNIMILFDVGVVVLQ